MTELPLSDTEPAGNVQLGLRLRGQLDAATLRRALEAVVARHDALRTGQAQPAGELTQLTRSAGLELRERDLSLELQFQGRLAGDRAGGIAIGFLA